MNRILLVDLGDGAHELVDRAARCCAHLFATDVEVLSDAESPAPAAGQQLLASTLLERLLRTPRGPLDRVLGITAHDLYLPMLSFVFGQAQLRGPAAVVSIARLDQRFYGLPEDPDLLARRLEREVAHELGHTFGLLHCPDPACCMSLSTSIEQVDAKNPEFCRDCRGRLRELRAEERRFAEAALASDSQEVQP